MHAAVAFSFLSVYDQPETVWSAQMWAPIIIDLTKQI